MAKRIVDHSVTLGDIAEGAKLDAEKTKKIAEKVKEQIKDNPNNKKEQVEEVEKDKPSKKTASTQKKKRGKKYRDAVKKVDKNKEYNIDEAVKLLKSIKYSNFNESVELHVNLGIDPKNNDQRIRFTTTLPHGTGKSVTVLVISDDDKGKDGAVIYRDKTAIDEIIKGKLVPSKDFDVVITKPEFMKDIAKAARILGPKGMMPSPKNGTVTNDIDKAIDQFSKGQIEVKNQSGHAILHQIVGKIDFGTDKLVENVEFLLSEIEKNKPVKTKKKFIQKVYLSSTMSPSVKIKY